MKTKLLLPIVALLALGLFLAGCATGMTPSSWFGMTADAEYAFVSGGLYVYAVNLETHVEAWKFQIKTSVYAAPVLTEDGQLLVGGYDHTLYSLDPADGSENWQFAEARDRWIGSPLVANEAIYAPNADYSLYALDLDGGLLWSFKADQSIWGTPVTDGELVYFGTLGSKVYALEAATGELAWEVEMDGAVLGSPVLRDGVLFFGLFDGALVALDSRDGSLVWQEALDSWAWSGPLLVDETLYIGDGAGNLSAFGLDGELLWRLELNGAIVGPPVLAGSEIAVGTEAGEIYYVSQDGEDIRTVSVGGQVYGPLLPVGTLTVVSPMTGTQPDSASLFIVLDENGARAWDFTPEK
jgi:outer membrane protein assembly factor BamB